MITQMNHPDRVMDLGGRLPSSETKVFTLCILEHTVIPRLTFHVPGDVRIACAGAFGLDLADGVP